jgi:hypothetical protein
MNVNSRGLSSEEESHMRGSSHMSVRRRPVAALCVTAVIAVAAVVLVASGRGTPSARAGSLQNGLSAYVVATNHKPLPACSDSCGPANTVWDYIHVVNGKHLVNESGTRLTVRNAFVVDSIDESITVDGQQYTQAHITPPPNITPPFPNWSARWPATVVCDNGPPCTDVQNPAVVPGEDIAVFFAGWIHGAPDPNGTFVFTYVIHGSVNGKAVDLTAAAPPIKMTP